VVPALPAQLDPSLFAQLVEMGLEKQSRVDLLAQEAFHWDAAGHDLNALATDTIKRGFKSWCKPQSKPTKKEFPHQQSSPVTEAQKQHGGRHSSAKRMARNLGDETDWEMPK
jgi:hypothetical protein